MSQDPKLLTPLEWFHLVEQEQLNRLFTAEDAFWLSLIGITLKEKK